MSARRPFGQNYAFVVVGVTFAALIAAAGLRAAPGVLMTPLQESLGWTRSDVSLTAAVGNIGVSLVDAVMDPEGFDVPAVEAVVAP